MAIYFIKLMKHMDVFPNFFNYGFEVDGKWWMTSEHYFFRHKKL